MQKFPLEVITIDERNRNEYADRDWDELPDVEEVRCGSDYKDATGARLGQGQNL